VPETPARPKISFLALNSAIKVFVSLSGVPHSSNRRFAFEISGWRNPLLRITWT
jgi:hypothetical protein